jgi:DNA processing protein
MGRESLKYWLVLNMVVGIGRTLFHCLVEELGSPRAVLSSSRSEWLRIQGLGEKVAGEIKNFDVDSGAERELRLVDKEGVRILTLVSP